MATVIRHTGGVDVKVSLGNWRAIIKSGKKVVVKCYRWHVYLGSTRHLVAAKILEYIEGSAYQPDCVYMIEGHYLISESQLRKIFKEIQESKLAKGAKFRMYGNPAQEWAIPEDKYG